MAEHRLTRERLMIAALYAHITKRAEALMRVLG